MHILLIHQYYLEKNDAGGSRFNEMTRIWADEGHNITVLSGMIHANQTKKYARYEGKYFFEEQYDNNIRVIRSHVSESYNISFLGRLWAYFSYVLSSILAGFFLARDKYDIIVVTSPPLFVGFTAYILSIFKKVPFLFEIRDLWPESAIDTGVVQNKFIIKLAYWFESFIYQKAKKINVLTPAFRDSLVLKKAINPEKICYIPNAADFSLSEEILLSFDANEFRKKLGIENKFVITYVGAHGVANHLDQLLETAELLKYSNVFFLLIGDGMKKQQLILDSQKKGLVNVRFINPVPKKEVFKYILASDMGTSVLKKVEAFKTVFANKTFDYMSCKKPVLMAIDGVSKDLIEKADAGTFIEPENAIDFAKKILLYVNNPELIKKQGENGYNYAKLNFDRRILALKYLEILKTMTKCT